ncbi:S8 family serine peptidase [Halomarina pelagica]|uniref:S8 family serine peptidase n=1 Tax=Halomarina pelagica TaxID=2961599 RepID=UPI0020C2FF89|nr:S8 family serine peptidase [Halomarina sp. BND7]
MRSPGDCTRRTGESTGVSRRTFVRAAGLLAGLGAVGVVASGEATAATPLDGAFLNWRAREARHVWRRGYRGRADRTVALTDSGVEARHPDLGPWNGVQAFVEDGEVTLTKPDRNRTERVSVGDAPSFSGTAGPGTFATGEEIHHEFTTPSEGVDELEAALSWSPNADAANDLELRLDRRVDGGWETVERAATAEMPETITASVEPDRRYRYAVELYLNTTTTYELTGEYFEIRGRVKTYDERVVFEGIDGEPTAETPKTVGWYDAGSRYGSYDRPRDGNGHGTHCSSIMAGSGRASAIDPDSVIEAEPRAALSSLTGGALVYEVDADAGTGVFGSAYGTGVELRIEGPDGREIDRTSIDSDASTGDNAVVEAPAETTGTYTVYVEAAGGTRLSTAYVERVGVGAFLAPDATAADRTGEDPSLHAGVAPNQSVLGLQGLSAPTADLARYAEDFTRIFNLRAVNMSWGYVGGLPLGVAGGTLDDTPAAIRDIAEAGVLTCAAAGNAATPANGNGAPAVADEAVSVVATGPLDGISAYSSGGTGAIDEDADFLSPEPDDSYTKPDVTAPGGYVTDLIVAARNGDPTTPEDEQPPIREYTGKAGTSMATPYTTGVAALVAQAMEEDAPASIALPAPEETGIEDVLRLKQTLLATASETVFTAAPYHRVKTPTYDFGGRDPYEGYGRVNPGAAVDAVTRELSGTTSDAVGLNVPDDERAVAGYVIAGPGTVTATVETTHLSGADQGNAAGDPHLDLFVYDAESPAARGEPNVLGRAQGLDGNATVSVSFGRDSPERTVLVVAKLVNVPGAVNGDDLRVHLDLGVEVEEGLFVAGTRTDDGSAFTGGQTNRVDLAVNPSETVAVRDVVPADWTVLTDASPDIERVEEGEGATYVYFRGEAAADAGSDYTYFAEAPDGLTYTGSYTFGPMQVNAGDGWVDVAGTSDANLVAGANTDL